MADNLSVAKQGSAQEYTNIGHTTQNFTYEYYYEYYVDCTNSSTAHTGTPLAEIGVDLMLHIFLPILCIGGIIGIILTVIVLGRKSMCTSTNTYLISLAVADLGFLSLLLCTGLERHLPYQSKHWYSFHVFYEYAQIFLHTFLLSSVWLTVMLAVERYIAICHPLKAISICTVKRSRIIIIIIFVCSFYCRVPNFFEIKVVTYYQMCGDSVMAVANTALGHNTTYKVVYCWIVDCIICAIIPFLFLVYLNIRLVMEIRKSTRYLKYHIGINSNMQNIVSHEQLKITIMLVSVIVVFFVCQAPYVIYTAYVNVSQFAFTGNHETFNILRCVTLFLLALKSAFNFILYCWFSEKFWNTFKRVFCLRYCMMKQSSKRKNHTVHSADNNATSTARKTSYLTKDTVC